MKAFKILLFILFLFFFSCKTDEDQEITDPAKAILGKWELVAITDNPYQPTGYIEYLPDSIMGWYDYNSKKYEILSGRYWIDSLLHYQNIYYPDIFPMDEVFFYSFHENKFDLVCANTIPLLFVKYIYQRKK
jgi:hypothetical protein